MFSNLIVKWQSLRKREDYLRRGLLLIILPAVISFSVGVALAEDAAFYQKGLSPAATSLLFTVQELSRAGKYRLAVQKIEQFNQGRTRDLPPLLGFVAGNLNFQLGNYHKSVNLYCQVVAAAPDFGQALENYGMALLQVEDYKEASRILLQAAEKVPKKSDQLKYKAAVAALYAGDYRRARSLLVALTATSAETFSSPPPAAWLKALIQVDWQLSDPQAALIVGERLVDLYPGEISHWRLYGQVAVAAGDWRKALAAYRVLQVEGHITIKERKLMAAIYQQLDLFTDAAEILTKVYSEDEPEAQELKQLVSLYRQIGQTEKALKTLTRLQKLYPDPMNLFMRGEILYAAGRYREAAEIFMALDKIPEENGRQFILAGYCAWNLDDFPAAASSWQQAAKYPAWQKQAQELLQTLKPWLKSKDS